MKRFENKQAGIFSSFDLKTTGGKTCYWLLFTLLLLTSVILFVPMLWTIATSPKDTQDIYGGFSFFPKDMSLR